MNVFIWKFTKKQNFLSNSTSPLLWEFESEPHAQQKWDFTRPPAEFYWLFVVESNPFRKSRKFVWISYKWLIKSTLTLIYSFHMCVICSLNQEIYTAQKRKENMQKKKNYLLLLLCWGGLSEIVKFFCFKLKFKTTFFLV